MPDAHRLRMSDDGDRTAEMSALPETATSEVLWLRQGMRRSAAVAWSNPMSAQPDVIVRKAGEAL